MSAAELQTETMALEVGAPAPPRVCPVRHHQIERNASRESLRSAFEPMTEAFISHAQNMSATELASFRSRLKTAPSHHHYPKSYKTWVDWMLCMELDARIFGRTPGESYVRPTTVKARKDLGRLFTMGASNAKTNSDTTIAEIATGRFPSFEWAPAERAKGARVFPSTVVVPNGAYGSALSRRLLEATRVLLLAADVYMTEDAKALARSPQYALLVRHATARGRDPRYLLSQRRAPAPLRTLREGIVSTAGALSLLCAEPLPGRDAMSAVRAVADGNAVSRLARRSQMGVVQPMVLRGHYIPSIVVVDVRGKVRLEPKVERVLMESRVEYNETLSTEPTPGETFLGCPVSSSLDALARSIVHIMELMSAEAGA